MKELMIEKVRDRVYILVDFSGFYDLGSVNCAFGNVLALLESEFPTENYKQAEFIVKYVLDGLAGNEKTVDIWGMTVKPTLLYSIYDFLDGKEKVDLTLRNIERMRIMHGININNLPLNLTNFDEGMKFQEISSALEVVYALLYYYAFNGYKLVKCEHCGRWFATTTFKIKYCPRRSTFPGYTHLNCEQAVKNIRQQCLRVKNRIETKINNAQQLDFTMRLSFLQECDSYYFAAKESPTVGNLERYYAFLCDTEKRKEWLNKR